MLISIGFIDIISLSIFGMTNQVWKVLISINYIDIINFLIQE